MAYPLATALSPRPGEDPRNAAIEAGRACAVARHSQQDLQQCADTYGELFTAKPFGTALYGSVALACAFGAPGLGVDALRVANRSALWVFAVDWLIDAQATSAGQVEDLVGQTIAVAEGGAPVDALGRFLADIAQELSRATDFSTHGGIWVDEVRRMMTAMAREWTWKNSATLPDLDAYLDNADNFGSCFVNVGHWIANDPPADRFPRALTASRVVQQVLRLLNDLRTYERDLAWGDLNALMLGPSRAEIEIKITELITRGQELLATIGRHDPDAAAYLDRQIGFSTGFYGDADFWTTV